MRSTLTQAALTAAILLQLPDMYWPQVIISIKFVTFYNQDGLRSDRQLCDGAVSSRYRPCDHFFNICLDNYNGDQGNVNTCQYSRLQTNTVWNNNFIIFDGHMLFTNPMLTTIPDAEEGILLKVAIWDADTQSPHDLVEMLSYQCRKDVTLAKDKGSANSKTQVIRGRRTRLTVEVSAYCAQHYFLRDGSCKTYCKPRDDDLGHFSCSEDGVMTCLPGLLCCSDVDECANDTGRYGVCSEENTTRCENLPGSYNCHCKPGFSGRRCEIGLRDDGSGPPNDDGITSGRGNNVQNGLLIGLLVGFLIIVIIGILVSVFLVRRWRRRREEEKPTNIDQVAAGVSSNSNISTVGGGLSNPQPYKDSDIPWNGDSLYITENPTYEDAAEVDVQSHYYDPVGTPSGANHASHIYENP